jgi:hypothetical protein
VKYRKKPIVIEAFIFGRHEAPSWFNQAVKDGVVEYHYINSDPEKHPPDGLKINTLEGIHYSSYGHEYIIQGVEGELYPCKPGIFEKTYEPVEDGAE